MVRCWRQTRHCIGSCFGGEKDLTLRAELTGELAMSEILPEGFLRFSEAVALLAEGMWGGLKRASPLVEFKTLSKGRGSVTFGPWREEASQSLTLAAVSEQMPVYVFGVPEAEVGDLRPKLTRVAGSVLARLIKVRSTFPDHPRVSMKAVERNGELYRALNTGVLVVRKSEFNGWYRRERRKGRWHSQHNRLNKEGRPSQRTEALRNAVAAIVADEPITIAELRRRLVTSGRTGVPSEDTLARVVDELYRETGDAKFRRPKRARRK
jgi:hypothetical protein